VARRIPGRGLTRGADPVSEPHHYPAHRYDDHLALRVPPLLWLAMVFLVRHPVLLGLTFLPTSGDTLDYLRALVQPIRLAADLPALLVLIAAARRRPTAGSWVRAIWDHGRWLLGASALVDGGLGIHDLVTTGYGQGLSTGDLIILAVVVDLWICLWLARSRLLRDLFRDFPAKTTH